MIEESYCSPEVSKLLRDKGFDIPVWTRYEDSNEVIFGDKYDWNNSPMGQTSAPTHQMAMRWLRETHNIDICVFPCYYDYITWGYYCKIYKDKEFFCSSEKFRTFEEALDLALLFVLQNMIFLNNNNNK